MMSLQKLVIGHTDDYSDDQASDGDTCSAEELNATFERTCKLISQKEILEGKRYILNLDATNETSPTIVLSSNDEAHVLTFSESQLVLTDQLPAFPEEEFIGVKFQPDNSNVIYVAYSQANIKLFDLRTPKKVVKTCIDQTTNAVGERKKLLSFDISPDNRLIAAGTDVYDGDAFVLFWDVRTAGLLGGYWEGHTDDITQVKFHRSNRNRMITGSTDGLINLYDLTRESEEDAFTDCLNTESSVENIEWCGENVFCATHTHEIQMWLLDKEMAIQKFSRDSLSAAIKRKSTDYSYVAGCIMDEKTPIFLVGSNYMGGEVLRAISRNKQPLFDCKENKQRVRTIHFNKQNRTLITAGEQGVVDVWKIGNLS